MVHADVCTTLASVPRPAPNVKFFRTGDPPPIVVPTKDGDEDTSALPPQILQVFADAVREKENWYVKVLKQDGLAEKWAEEAWSSPFNQHRDALALLRELKAEARRLWIMDHSIQLIPLHLPDRPVDFSAIKVAVEKAVDYLRTSQYGIDTPKLYENVGAFFADDVVPQVLHTELVHELGALAAIEPKDFHPGACGKVQDLIHPSLYPYMADVTPIAPSITQAPTINGKFTTYMREMHEHKNQCVTMASAFAWIPTVFAVSEDGKDVSIEGYINGLGSREQYPALYKILEETFKIAMPMLESTMKGQGSDEGRDTSMERFYERRDYGESEGATKEGWYALIEEQKKKKEAEEEERILENERKTREKATEKMRYEDPEWLERPSGVTSWAGKKLKVVVKAANYILEPGQAYTGTWHIEGMPHERIVASAIYYYERDTTIVDAGLYLRYKRDGKYGWPNPEDDNRDLFSVYLPRPEPENSDDEDDDYDYDEDYINNAPSDYGSDAHMADLPAYVNVGVIPTVNEQGEQGTGRIITFPNWVQHRVMGVYNDPSASSVATRKILCFFLVDDTDQSDEIELQGLTYEGMGGMRVLTSSDVAHQARPCNLPTLSFLLCVACRQRTSGRRTLPSELLEIILNYAKGIEFGISREEAEKRRRALMEDRKVQTKDINGLWSVRYSLCEH